MILDTFVVGFKMIFQRFTMRNESIQPDGNKDLQFQKKTYLTSPTLHSFSGREEHLAVQPDLFQILVHFLQSGRLLFLGRPLQEALKQCYYYSLFSNLARNSCKFL